MSGIICRLAASLTVPILLIGCAHPASSDDKVEGTTAKGELALNANQQPFTIYAHRGAQTEAYTENTMAAFNAARLAGVRGVEADISLSRDRKFVLMHDDTLNRTTTCSGEVANRTWHQIRTQCRGKERGEKIPSARHLLRWAERHNMSVLLETKAKSDWSQADFERLADLMERFSMTQRTALISFSAQHLRLAKAASSNITTQFIVNDLNDVSRLRGEVDAFNLYARHMTPELVADLQADGLRVLGRNTQDPNEWLRIREAGADGLVTDRASSAANNSALN